MSGNDAFFDGFLDDYFAESEEHLTAAADTLLRLDKSIGQPAAERAASTTFPILPHAEGDFRDGRAASRPRSSPIISSTTCAPFAKAKIALTDWRHRCC